MREREEIRDHLNKIWKETDPQKRAFKLFVVGIEVSLDLRDLLQPIAEDARRHNIEAAGKLAPCEKSS